MKKASLPASGFTLVELAVVLVLMGAIAALAIPNFGSRAGDPLKDAERFAAVLHHVAQDSILSGHAMGVEITAPEYRVLSNRRGVWVPMDNEKVFRPRSWADGLSIALHRSGSEGTGGVPGQPSIVFSATGEATAFSVLMTTARAQARVIGSEAGDIQVIRETDG